MVAKTVALPNVKRLFIPDPGYTIGDFDLAQADAQVVAWESGDESLMEFFKRANSWQKVAGVEKPDLHTENAIALGVSRPLAKAGVHATNYGVSARTLGITLGITTREAQYFIDHWFDLHPGIPAWHERIIEQLSTDRTVTNAFGYRRQYFGRIDTLFNEAVAWIPQSTVALIITKALIEIDAHMPDVHLLMQVHDSIVCQWPTVLTNPTLRGIKRCMEIEVPYPDPLVIPVGAEISDISWGDCKARPWPKELAA